MMQRCRSGVSLDPACTYFIFNWLLTASFMTNVKQNRAAWNRLAETGSQFASVATDEELQNPLQTLETRGWLPPDVTGLNVLCLAGGGGWQSILYAAAGADDVGEVEVPMRRDNPRPCGQGWKHRQLLWRRYHRLMALRM